MSSTRIGICTLRLYIPMVASLKDKRSIVKSLLTKVKNQFNASTAEVDLQDKWQSAEIAIAVVSNSDFHNRQTLMKIIKWIESHYPEVTITQQDVEIL